MNQLDPPHHRHSQWAPKAIEVRLQLSKKSLKPQDRFYSRISTQEGYTIGLPCFFTTTSRDNNSFRVQIVRDLNNEEKPISFHVLSNLRELSAACSKLNMANAMKCKIIGRLDNDEFVNFSIIAPDEATEKSLLWHFSIFEVGSQTTH